MIRPTSKAALKQQCLYLSNLDIDKAEKMYAFLIKDMEDIPAIESDQKPFIKNIGEQATELFGWFRENQDMIGQGVEFIKGLVQKKGPVQAAVPLPNINE